MPWTYHGDGAPAGSDNPIVNGNLTVTGDEAIGGNGTIAGTLGVTGAITPSQTAGIVGTTTNNNANAGAVGELLTASLPSGTPVALTTNTQATVVSLSLTAGDWEVSGNLSLIFAASTSYTAVASGVSAVTNALPAEYVSFSTPAAVPGNAVFYTQRTINYRFSLLATTPVYLVAYALFTVSTLGAFGTIRARRVR